jgi:hypothetical protein
MHEDDRGSVLTGCVPCFETQPVVCRRCDVAAAGQVRLSRGSSTKVTGSRFG